MTYNPSNLRLSKRYYEQLSLKHKDYSTMRTKDTIRQILFPGKRGRFTLVNPAKPRSTTSLSHPHYSAPATSVPSTKTLPSVV